MLTILDVLIGLVVLVLIILWTDRRWYKRHPGAEERFNRIDDELTRQEQR